MARREEESVIEEGSGNVFADLDLPDAEEMLAKAKLMSAIQDAIDARALSEVQASDLMGIDQPMLSRLLHGDLGGFPTERLLALLRQLGLDVDIVVHSPATPGKREGAISVAFV